MNISAKGWLNDFLNRQMSGLTGHIEAAGAPFNELYWGTNTPGKKTPWYAYEQTGYWIDGFVRCAVLLKDEKAIEKVSKIIYSVLNNPDKDGYLGPVFLKYPDDEECCETDADSNPNSKRTEPIRWPHVVFFRACLFLYEYNQDEKIIQALCRHYLSCNYDYSFKRDILNAEIMLRLYGYTKNEKLLKLAEDNYFNYNRWCTDDACDVVALSDKKPFLHGVTYCEFFKLGALFFIYTGKKHYLDVSVAAFDKVEKLFLLPNGCLCSNECVRSNYYWESSETCDVSDYTWALYALAEATGDNRYYDFVERCVFNAGLGATTDDFKALQYFSYANQVVADKTSNYNLFCRGGYAGGSWMSYRPSPSNGHCCCTGNVNRFMPNYILHSWVEDDEYITCNMYGPSIFYGKKATVEEITEYPFNENMTFKVTATERVNLRFRVPRWSKHISLKKNGENVPVVIDKNYLIVSVDGDDTLEVRMHGELETVTCYDGTYFRKGALVYSLGGKIDWQIDKNDIYSTKDFPAYNAYADFEWRYCIAENADEKFFDGTGNRYDNKNLPYVEVNVRRLPELDFIKETKIKVGVNHENSIFEEFEGNYTFTPDYLIKGKPSEIVERVKLYPFGTQKLRWTVMHKLGSKKA